MSEGLQFNDILLCHKDEYFENYIIMSLVSLVYYVCKIPEIFAARCSKGTLCLSATETETMICFCFGGGRENNNKREKKFIISNDQ